MLGPESAPTVQMPRGSDARPDRDNLALQIARIFRRSRTGPRPMWIPPRSCAASTPTASTWISTGSPTPWDPATPSNSRAPKTKVFSTEVFEASQRNRKVDLDVGEALNGSEAAATNKLKTYPRPSAPARSRPQELALPELEPVTMSEVGTKLDLARAYMDMGDPEGARSILEEVVSEGSASQKQEAQRLIENLPG